ncbi:MAG: hypothetical protein GWM92_04745 [Gemmatimonadetes bacterium]|nr:hypothetical protein [Gemmatimonadota bacterium]NIR77882.1 hypothetical protein [Gemmatimonadota bacterium]NIT86427.1 hypothetical protein [Gemmatimonadota bacterium]NIU30264.1 hypothetical protein [Gemmatimonadota bacterium]NIU35168.1 hypothetical protein [Gemmatimonadota bacterium]
MSDVPGTTRRVLSLLLVAGLAGTVGCEAPGPSGPAPEVELATARVGGPGAVDIVTFDDGTVVGEASLTRAGNGVTLRAHMDADEGETFTVWSAVFNNPGECDGPCDAGDIFDNPPVGGNFIRIAGGVAGGDGLHVSGRLREGDASEGLIPGAPALMDAMTAEIHFIYRSHGQRIAGQIDEQTMSLNGGCPPNDCVDVAFSVHAP